MRGIFLSLLIIGTIMLDDVQCWRRRSGRRRRAAPPPQPPKPQPPKPQPPKPQPVKKTEAPKPAPTQPPNPKLVTLDDGKLRFVYVGCYDAPGHIPPKLKELILTERDTSSPVWDGNNIDWYNWDVYMPAFINRCARKAYNKDYKVFGLRYYGECYGDPTVTDAEAVFTTSMKKPSECVKEDYADCEDGDARCIGKHHGLAVYQMLP